MNFGKILKIFITILWLIVFAPAIFLVGLLTPRVSKLLAWARNPDITSRERLIRYLAAAPVMIIFVPLVFITSLGAGAIETNFTKHI